MTEGTHPERYNLEQGDVRFDERTWARVKNTADEYSAHWADLLSFA